MPQLGVGRQQSLVQIAACEAHALRLDAEETLLLLQHGLGGGHGGAAVEMFQRVAMPLGAAQVEQGLDAAIDAAAAGPISAATGRYRSKADVPLISSVSRN